MPTKRKKGSAFEREVCRLISLWWSDGRYDDLVWRTAGSGARATVRSKKGRRTTGHCGDIGSTHPLIDPFFRVVTVEVKRGYQAVTPHDLIDYAGPETKNGRPRFDTFLKQAADAALRAGTPYWLLIHRRNGRGATVAMPYGLVGQLNRTPFP